MKKTRSILMVVLMLVVALSLSGCTLFGNKDKVEKEDNAQVAARGVMLAITDEDAGSDDVKAYIASNFKTLIKVNVGDKLDFTLEDTFDFSLDSQKITNLFETIREKMFRGNSVFDFTYADLNGSKNKVTVQVGSGASSDEIKAFCKYEVKINDILITEGKITFTMKSDNQNNVVITGIEIVINVLNN